MKTVIICTDCGGCCSSIDKQISDDQFKLVNKNINFIKSKCMGICPTNKFSTLVLESNVVNDYKIQELDLNQVFALIN